MKYKAMRISEEQERIIREKAKDSEIELAVFLSLSCGMRMCEIMDFEKEDFDEMMGWIRIPYRHISDSIKHRVLLLSAEECDYLKRYLSAHPFIHKYSKQHTSLKVRQIVSGWGMPGIGLRELRHTAISRKIEECMMGRTALAEVSHWAGYSDCATFYATYRKEIYELRRKCWRKEAHLDNANVFLLDSMLLCERDGRGTRTAT